MHTRQTVKLLALAMALGLGLTPALAGKLRITRVVEDSFSGTLVISGTGFGAQPRVFLGNETGSFDELSTVVDDANTVEAELPPVSPGTYMLRITQSEGKRRMPSQTMMVTLGAASQVPTGSPVDLVIRRAQSYQTIDPGKLSQVVVAQCPAGTSATGGGATANTTSATRAVLLSESKPTIDEVAYQFEGWMARWVNLNGVPTGTTLTVTVICAASE